MIPVSFKCTAKFDIATPLNGYLESKYGKTEAGRHAEAVSALQTMRNDVASVQSANEGCREVLARYLHALDGAAAKFPVSETSVRIPFVWTDTLKPSRQVSLFSWAYERASVLFNLAALESYFACTTSRDSPEGIERAAKHYCTCAGILLKLKTDVNSRLIGALPLDMMPEGLTMVSVGPQMCGVASWRPAAFTRHCYQRLSSPSLCHFTLLLVLSLQLMNVQLAQAQACYYEMAQRRSMKPETLARIAGQAADLYRAASRALSESQLADIEDGYPWGAYLRMHAASFDSASFWQMSHKARADADATGAGYGVEIAWLTVADNASRAAVNAVQSSPHPLAAKLDVTNTILLQQKVAGRRAEAENDNNKIYCNPIPPARDLPAIPRAELAKPLAASDYAEFKGRDLFAGVVPVEVNSAMTELDDRLTLLATEAKDRATKATEDTRGALSALGLPGALDANEGSGAGLPPALWERIRKVQIAGGLAELNRLFTSNAAAREAAVKTLGRVTQTLDDEASADAACRRQFGARWTATPSDVISAEIRGEAAKYSKVAEAAGASDATVAAKMEANQDVLAELDLSKATLDAHIPAGAGAGGAAGAAGAAAESLRSQLREALAALNHLLDERPRLAAAIKERFDRPAAVAAYIAVTGSGATSSGGAGAAADAAAPSSGSDASTSAVTERLLTSGTAAATRALDENLSKTAASLETIRALHARYGEVRAQDERTVARERALQRLAQGVDRHEELRSNLREGENFYRDLRAQAERLLVTAEDMAAARGLQQRELMLNLRAASEAEERSRTDADLAARMAATGMDPAAPAGASAAPGGARGPAYPTMGAVPTSAVAVPLPPSGGAGGAAAGSVGGPVMPPAYNPFDTYPAGPAAGAGASASSSSSAAGPDLRSFSAGDPFGAPASPRQGVSSTGSAGFVPNPAAFNRAHQGMPSATGAGAGAGHGGHPAPAYPGYAPAHGGGYAAPGPYMAAPAPGPYGVPAPAAGAMPYGYGAPAAAAPAGMPMPYGYPGAAPMAPGAGMPYGHGMGGMPAAAPGYGLPPSGPPPAPQVQQLMGMGFARADAERALARTGGDVGLAVSALLDGSGRV